MKKVVCFLLFLPFVNVFPAFSATQGCGAGYILVETRNKIDGIPTSECQKLWCRDLETNRPMGSGDKAYSGYQKTSGPVELCDAKGICVECWGERVWCSGAKRGEWVPEIGAYTRGGGDDITYLSYQKSNCFDWRLEKPNCKSGQTAILENGKWKCAVPADGAGKVSRESSIRRTGAVRRIKI